MMEKLFVLAASSILFGMALMFVAMAYDIAFH